jgi:hypothetical protein
MARAGGEQKAGISGLFVNAYIFLKSEFFLQIVDIGSTVLEVLVS